MLLPPLELNQSLLGPCSRKMFITLSVAASGCCSWCVLSIQVVGDLFGVMARFPFKENTLVCWGQGTEFRDLMVSRNFVEPAGQLSRYSSQTFFLCSLMDSLMLI